MARVLIAGCGDVGSAFGSRLALEGYAVWGLRRCPEGLPSGIQALPADLTRRETLRALPAGLDFVFYTAGADGASDEAYCAAYVEGLRNLLEALQIQNQRPQRVFFTSSTAVYAQSSGEWVDEGSPTDPVHFSGRRLLEAERLLLGGRFPATVLRLAGIYGPRRARLIDSVRQGTAVCTNGPAVYMNLISRDDCAGALYHLMRLREPDPLYLGVDHEPVERNGLLGWLAAQLGVRPPRVAAAAESQTSRSRSNKRCLNVKLVASGYQFRFPTFREGFAVLLAGTDSYKHEPPQSLLQADQEIE